MIRSMMTIPGRMLTMRNYQKHQTLHAVSKPHHTAFGNLRGTPADSSSSTVTFTYFIDSILPYLQEKTPADWQERIWGGRVWHPSSKRGRAQVRFLPAPQRSHGGGPSTKTGAEFYLLSMMFRQPVGGWVDRQSKQRGNEI